MSKPIEVVPQEAVKNDRTLEVMLIVVTAGLAAVLYSTDGVKMVALNLFYLPVVLAGFFLGRYRAGILALLSVVVATIVIAQDLNDFANSPSPLMVGLAITLWGAVLGLTALMVGTLCDDLVAKAVEAHEAHVGVVEVLARYLQAANPHLESRAKRIANLAEKVARKMRLSSKEIDDIRVAALLMDIENIEITARVIKKAVGELEDRGEQQRTFHGSELVQSLGPACRVRSRFCSRRPGTTRAARTARSATPLRGPDHPVGAVLCRTRGRSLGDGRLRSARSPEPTQDRFGDRSSSSRAARVAVGRGGREDRRRHRRTAVRLAESVSSGEGIPTYPGRGWS